MARSLSRWVKRMLMSQPSKAHYKFVLKDWVRLFDTTYCAHVLETKRFSRNLRPLILERPHAKRIVVVAPHTDDDTFGAGGTLLKSLQAGARVDVIYVTSVTGDAPRDQRTKEEAIAVCRRLGATPHFMGLSVGEIPVDDHRLRDRMRSLLETLKPDVLFITFLLDDHDDHRRVNELLLKSYPDGIVEVWAYQIYSTVLPNVVVDITEQMERKRELMRMWRSVKGDRDWTHYISGMNAANCRFVSGKREAYVEAFFVVPLSEYLQLCRIYFTNPADRIYYNTRYQHRERTASRTVPTACAEP